MLGHQGKKEGKTRIISLDINAADVFANVLFQLVTFNDSDAMSQSQIKSGDASITENGGLQSPFSCFFVNEEDSFARLGAFLQAFGIGKFFK